MDKLYLTNLIKLSNLQIKVFITRKDNDIPDYY